MAEFVFRTRPAIRPVGLVLFLLFLAGCATIPKTAPTQFANFSSVTDKLSEDTSKIYDYAYSLEEALFKEQFVQTSGMENSIWSYTMSYASPNDLAFKKLLLDTLKAYAQNLKYIMSNEIDAGLEASIPDLAGKLLALKTSLLPKITLPTGFDETSVSNAGIAIAKVLLDRTKKREVLASLDLAIPSIVVFIDLMQKEIGTCGDTTKPVEYCNNQKPYSGHTIPLLNNRICDSFREFVALQFRNIPNLDKKDEARSFRKTMLTYRIKRDNACSMLAIEQTVLDSYKNAIQSLPDALNNPKSDKLTKALAITSTQLGIMEQLLQQSAI